MKTKNAPKTTSKTDPDRIPLMDAMPKTTKKAKAPNAKATPKPAKVPKEKKLSGLDAAAKVVASAKEPLNAQTIAERAIAAGWKTSGKTPHATLYAAIIREIAAKGKDARFKKTERGLFTSTGKS